jgi:hypothetical protein
VHDGDVSAGNRGISFVRLRFESRRVDRESWPVPVILVSFFFWVNLSENCVGMRPDEHLLPNESRFLAPRFAAWGKWGVTADSRAQKEPYRSSSNCVVRGTPQ